MNTVVFLVETARSFMILLKDVQDSAFDASGSNSCDSLRELQGNALNVLKTIFLLDPPGLQMILFPFSQT